MGVRHHAVSGSPPTVSLPRALPPRPNMPNISSLPPLSYRVWNSKKEIPWRLLEVSAAILRISATSLLWSRAAGEWNSPMKTGVPWNCSSYVSRKRPLMSPAGFAVLKLLTKRRRYASQRSFFGEYPTDSGSRIASLSWSICPRAGRCPSLEQPGHIPKENVTVKLRDGDSAPASFSASSSASRALTMPLQKCSGSVGGKNFRSGSFIMIIVRSALWYDFPRSRKPFRSIFAYCAFICV
mmetsp:Transcript_83132/g.235823  ORF Transcript_83132/g.235823 Transcript_83132/m.235823 type:complete len:239 (+) Transcript_83132:161-877(+)